MDRNSSAEEIISHFKSIVTATRKNLLDLLELAYGTEPNWPIVRSRILNELGNSGLGGEIEMGRRILVDKTDQVG